MHYKTKQRQMKEFITSLFYTDVPFFRGSVTTLAGSQLQRVVELFKHLDPDSINVYETCPRVFEKQVRDKYRHYPDEDINLHFDSIENAPVTEFIDADLMSTFKSDGKIIEELFKRQINMQHTQTKVFVGTVSLRTTPRADVIDWLNNLVSLVDKDAFVDKEEIEYAKTEGSLIFLRKHKTQHSSNIEALDAFTYSDKEGLMFTFRIIY